MGQRGAERDEAARMQRSVTRGLGLGAGEPQAVDAQVNASRLDGYGRRRAAPARPRRRRRRVARAPRLRPPLAQRWAVLRPSSPRNSLVLTSTCRERRRKLVVVRRQAAHEQLLVVLVERVTAPRHRPARRTASAVSPSASPLSVLARGAAARRSRRAGAALTASQESKVLAPKSADLEQLGLSPTDVEGASPVSASTSTSVPAAVELERIAVKDLEPLSASA